MEPLTASSVRLTEPELVAWGRRLGERALEERAFVALIGPLGAGKTTLVRAACRGVGIEGVVPSPTFTLVHEYRVGTVPLFHADLYRLSSPAELDDIGWDDLLAGHGPVFVEWAERAGPHLPADRWEIRLRFDDSPDRRVAEAESLGRAPPLPPFGTDD